jgi:DNA-directed RNA polymerase subunit beta'
MATTLGQHLVDSILPLKWQGKGVLTKGVLNNVLLGVAKEDVSKYPDVVTKLKRLGDEVATLDGISVGLDDIAPRISERDAALKPHVEAFRKATTNTDKVKALVGGQNAMLTLARNHPGTMGEMVRAGGRGNAAQLMRTVGAPVFAEDSKGKVIPWLVDKSFSEGLKPADAWIMGGQARVNAVVSNISVVEPGDLAKILVNNMGDQLVTTVDCGTKNGIAMLPTDAHLIDRYQAGTNKLITPQYAAHLAKEGKEVIVRSPMTCEAAHGVCQHCQGLSSSGGMHSIGTNVGVRAAQALAEPLTQFALNAKHGGRVVGVDDEKRLEGIKGVRALLEIPTSFAHKAVLADRDGSITKVDKAPQGGHYVFVGDGSHYVPPAHKVVVGVGQSVYAGDLLSDGVPKPDEIVQHKGLGEGRRYLVDALSDVYKRAGSEVDKRHLETLAKSVLNHVQIVDPGPDDAFIKGDVVDYNRFHASLAAAKKRLPTADAIGETLADGILHHTAGTVVTQPIADQLVRHGVTSVMTSSQGPRALPFMRPASRTPLLNPDWMARLAHRYLKESLLTGIHRGDVSNLHGASPVPAYVAGTEFGLGEEGQY